MTIANSDNERGWAGRFTDQYRRFLPIAMLAGCILVAVSVYGGTRDFSFMMDDAFDTTWTEQRSYWEILSERFPGFGYFRPLPFIIFKASYDLTGEHNTELLRTILIAGHALSAWLLYMLLRRLVQSEWSIAAAALFLLFPFSYQAINVIGAIGHVLVTMLLLSALLLWYEGRSRSSPYLLAASVLLAVTAIWTMEYGVIGLPLLVGLELLIRYRSGGPLVVRSGLIALGVIVLAQAVFLGLWFGTDRPESDPVTLDDAARNFVFWLQIVAYPLTRFLNLISPGDAPGYRVVLPASLLVLSAAFAAHAVLRQGRIAAVALIVAFVCFLPSLFMLTHEYVLSGPRLLYVVAPAIAAFWALLGRAAFAHLTLTRAWQTAVLLFLAVTILHSHSFVERRVEMFSVSNDVIDSIVDVADSSRGRPVLIMNAPEWFSFHSLADQEYPIGHLGVQGVPSYLGFDGLYYAVRGESAEISSGALAPFVTRWTYAWSPHGPFLDHDQVNQYLRDGYQLHVMRLAGEGPYVFQPGRIVSEHDDSASQATFDGRITMHDARWELDDRRLRTDITWRMREPLGGDYQISFEVIDPSGDTVWQHRDYALSGMSPPRLWQSGDTVIDRSLIELPEDITVSALMISFVNTGDESTMPVADAEVDIRGDDRIILRQ